MMGASRQAAQERLERRREARQCFEAFCGFVYPKYMKAEHQHELCSLLNDVAEGRCTRAIIEVPPRNGKSFHISERFPPYLMGRFPEYQIIATSHSDGMSRRFGRKVHSVISSAEFKELFPGVSLSKRADAVDEFETEQGGRYIATGIAGDYMGTGAQVVIVDDPFKNREQAESQTYRDKVWERFDDLETRLEPGGAFIILHTRWHEDDLIGRVIKERVETGKEEWRRLTMPMIKNECHNWEKVEAGDGTDEDQRKYDAEKSIWPERWPLEACRRIRRNKERRTWISLYQQQPSSKEGDKYRRSYFQRYNFGEQPKNLHKYIISDFAVTKDDGDWTEFYVVGRDHEGKIWWLDAWFDQVQADEWIPALVNLIKLHKPFGFYGEKGQIRKAVEPFLEQMMLQERAITKLIWLDSSTDKLARSRASIGLASMRRFYIPRCSWGDRLVDQHAVFPASNMDHSVDCTSQVGRAFEVGPSKPAKPKEEKEPDRWARIFEMSRYRGAEPWKVA